MDKIRSKATIYLIITAILWSTGGLFIKLVDWNPLAIAGSRSGISAIVMLIYLRKPKPFTDFSRKKVIGAAFYAALVILFVTANKLTTSANAILLQFTAPVWVALFSKWILKEKIKSYDWLVISVVMLGMTLFFMGDLDGGYALGNIAAIASGIAMAAVVISLKLQDNGSPVEMTLLGNIFTLLIGLPFFFVSVPSFSSLIGILFLGVFQLGISYILYATAIKHVSALEAILIPVIEPLLNPIWVLWFTGEVPTFYGIVGGIIVVSAIIVRSLYHREMEVQKA